MCDRIAREKRESAKDNDGAEKDDGESKKRVTGRTFTLISLSLCRHT